jgi:Helix-turn-helix domain
MQVTIPEAAKLLRVSERTVRRRLGSGELKGRQVSSVGGFAWMVDLPDTVTQDGQEPGQVDSLTAGEIAAMKALMARMESQIEAQQKQLDVKDSQIRELHILLQQAQTALPSPQGTHHSWWRFWQRD